MFFSDSCSNLNEKLRKQTYRIRLWSQIENHFSLRISLYEFFVRISLRISTYEIIFFEIESKFLHGKDFSSKT